MLGYTAEELTALGSNELTHPGDRAQAEQVVRSLLAHEHATASAERRFLTRDRGIISTRVRTHVHRGRDGRPTYLVSQIEDLVALKRADAAVRAGELRRRRLLDTLMDAYVEVDLSGKIVGSNAEYQRLVGYSAEELAAMTYQELTPAKWHAMEARIIEQEVLRNGHSRTYEKEYRRRDGTIVPIELRAALLRDDDGATCGMAAMVRDLTPRQAAAQERVRTARLLEARVRLMELSDRTLTELGTLVLDILGEQTDSPIGFFHLVQPDQETLALVAWSTRTLKEFCTASGAGMHYPVSSAGVWADALRERRAIVHNDYPALAHRHGLPEGHAAVHRELVVPILRDGLVVAILGVGNKPAPYTKDDETTVQYLADLAWDVIEHRRAAANTAALLQATRAVVAQQELGGAIAGVFDACRTLMQAHDGYIASIDDAGEPKLLVAYATTETTTLLDKLRPLRAAVHESGKQVSDNGSGPLASLFPEGNARPSNLLLTPLRSGGRTIGELMLGNRAGGFTEHEARLAEAFGELASMAIERSRSVRALEAAAARLSAVFEAVSVGVAVTDLASNKIESTNAVFRTMTGFTEAQVLTMSPIDFVEPAARAEVGALVTEHALAGNGHATLTLQRPDQSTLTVDVSSRAMRLDGREYLVTCMTDVTEKRRLQASLAQSDRLASMGLLAAGVAHEINNPLSYILYNLEGLAEDVPQLRVALRKCDAVLAKQPTVDGRPTSLPLAADETAERMTGQVRAALEGIERIREIVRGLSTFSRSEASAVEPTNVEQAIEHALVMVHNEMKYRARVVRSFSRVPLVLASAGKLGQVFLNLLINATHAIVDGDVESNEILVHTWAEDGFVHVEVQDTGQGIPDANLPRLFEPFFTTKGAGIGSGLGLPICKKIVEEFGGTIRCRSELGRGTTFTVTLPALPESWEESTAPPPPEAPSGARGRILVVDDEKRVRDALAGALRREHEVVTASSGREAQALLERDARFDLLILDVMMPVLSGTDLHAWLVERDPALAAKVVFATGGAFSPRAAEYLEQVPNLRIHKPFDSADLRALARERVSAAREDRSP